MQKPGGYKKCCWFVLYPAPPSYYYALCIQLTHLMDAHHYFGFCLEQHATKPVYGCSLEEHLQSSGRKIALVIEECIHILYPSGLEEEGLFRIAAGASILKKLKV